MTLARRWTGAELNVCVVVISDDGVDAADAVGEAKSDAAEEKASSGGGAVAFIAENDLHTRARARTHTHTYTHKRNKNITHHSPLLLRIPLQQYNLHMQACMVDSCDLLSSVVFDSQTSNRRVWK